MLTINVEFVIVKNSNEKAGVNVENYTYITNNDWFESGSLKNPITVLDHKLEKVYPEFYSLDYDLKLLATKSATNEEKSAPFYNDYREKHGSSDIQILKTAAAKLAKTVFLNGFNQKHIKYIIPFIKDTVEVLYLYKCHQIKDLSILSELKNLKCLFVYWNNSFDCLWDMKNNQKLKIISFISVTKLSNIDALINSNVEYITFNSADNSGNKKYMLFDKSVFDKMSDLKHLTLIYKDCDIDY